MQDIGKAKTFYESVLKMSMKEMHSPVPGLEMCGFPSAGETFGATGALAKMEGVKSGAELVIGLTRPQTHA